MKAYSQITFFYYDDLKAAQEFYEKIFPVELVQDQRKARIYRIGKSFFGIVDGRKGSLRPQAVPSAMLTIIVDDVKEWHEYLISKDVRVVKGTISGTYIETAYYRDPGGYIIETQRFLKQRDSKTVRRIKTIYMDKRPFDKFLSNGRLFVFI